MTCLSKCDSFSFRGFFNFLNIYFVLPLLFPSPLIFSAPLIFFLFIEIFTADMLLFIISVNGLYPTLVNRAVVR